MKSTVTDLKSGLENIWYSKKF